MLYLLAQAATAPSTQEAVQRAVDAKADQWYAPLLTAFILGGVAFIGLAWTSITAWLKARAAVAEAQSQKEIAVARAEAAAAEARGQAEVAKARAEAAAAASAVNSDRITTTARKVDAMQDTLTKVALQTPPMPGDAPKGQNPC